MNEELKKHINKVLKALSGLIKRSNYGTEFRKTINDTEFLLQSLLESLKKESKIGKEEAETLKSNLNKFKKGVFKEDEEVINSINEIIKQI